MERPVQTINENSCEIKSSQTSNSKQHVHSNKLTWDDDIFRVRTIEECELICDEYCEQRLEQLRESADKLSVLRSCCELLTRLEGTIHDSFAGRVLIFLAKFVPFYDRSGLNSKHEYGFQELPESVKEHLKKIEEKNGAKLRLISEVTGQEIEEGETISDDDDQVDEDASKTPSNSHQIDPEKLFEKFWRIQEFLNRPDQLYDKNNWFSFRTKVDMIVLYFETNPAQYNLWKLDSLFMTEPKTFNLQINDVNMRRCLCVQILIILDLLDSQTEIRPESLRLDNLQYNWIKTSSARLFDLLGTMPNKKEGHNFLALVTHILREEAHWTKWKHEKCAEPKSITKDDDEFITMGSTYHKRRKTSDELKSAKPYNMHVIGSPDVCRLWNKRAQQSVSSPDVTKYFSQPPEKQMDSFKDPQTSFRILRLLRKSPYFFVPAASVIQSLDGYLKALADKHFNVNNSGIVSPQSTVGRTIGQID